MSSRVRLKLNVRAFHGLERSEAWASKETLRAILDAIEAAGLWLEWTGFGPLTGAAPIPAPTPAQVAEHPQALRFFADGAQLFTGPSPGDGSWISLDAGEGSRRGLEWELLYFRALLQEPDWRGLAGNPLDALTELFFGVRDLLPGPVLTGDEAAIVVPSMPRAVSRPVRFAPAFGLSGGAVIFLDPAWHAEDRWEYFEQPQELAKLLQAEVPAAGKRFDRDGITVFRWVDDPRDEEALGAGISAQERWTGRTIAAEVQEGWKECGDWRDPAHAAQPHPDVTFYGGWAGPVGWQTAVVDGSRLDDEIVAKAQRLLSAGVLSDGQRLDRLNLVLPTREAAVRVREHALSVGFTAIEYMDAQGRFWDPWPPNTFPE